MEPQSILYIVAGILYFLYSLKKASDERKKQQPPSSTEEKPVTPPSTFGDILREIKKQQEQAMPKKPVPVQQEKPVVQKRTQRQDTVLDEMRKASEAEVLVTDKAAAAENKRLERSLYHIQTEEEQEQAQLEHRQSFDLDVRQAFIGSLIFERKYQ